LRDTPHSTNETGATNCYIQKTEEKHGDRHENIDAMKWRLEHRAVWGFVFSRRDDDEPDQIPGEVEEGVVLKI